MFEVESRGIESTSPISKEVIPDAANYYSRLDAVSLFHWEEHCTECAAPACYSSCSLYEPRKDGKCRRFSEGIVPLDGVNSLYTSAVAVKFKRWGSLMAKADVRMFPLGSVKKLAKKISMLERLGFIMPDGGVTVAGRKAPMTRLIHRLKMRMIRKAAPNSALAPTHFVAEVFNPSEQILIFVLTIRASTGEKMKTPFQRRIEVDTGFSRIRIEFSDISRFISLGTPSYYTITPEIDETSVVTVNAYFGFIGYVCEQHKSEHFADTPIPVAAPDAKPVKSVKIVVWDLDNTLWQGTLVEDGIDGVALREEAKALLLMLDKRGIVNSIASKNDPSLAMSALTHFGIAEYFIFPKIGWQPKSEALREIVADFDVGEDTIAFVDDQPFERQEVLQVLPKVRVYDACEVPSLGDRAEFNPPLSAESSSRRQFYAKQALRKDAQQGFSGEYVDFLRSCQIELSIRTPTAANIERLHELVQRTNQLNFSGKKYDIDELRAILESPALDKFQLSCCDRFGDYGTIGFAIVDPDNMTLTDMMFSCRVQSKAVEHSFLSWLASYYSEKTRHTGLTVRYTKTERNGPAARVLTDIDFRVISSEGSSSHYYIDFEALQAFHSPITVVRGS